MRTGLVACAILVLASCASVPAGKVQTASKPGSSFALLRQMQGGDFVSSPELVQYVRQVGSRLARASRDERRERCNACVAPFRKRAESAAGDFLQWDERPYEIVVIDRSSSESWSLPGGQVALTRGLLREIPCEAQLAEVLAQQMAASYSGVKAEQSENFARNAEVLPAGTAVAAARLGKQSVDSAVAARIRSEAAEHLERAGYLHANSTARGCARHERATRALHAADDAYASYDGAVAALREHDLPSAQAHASAALVGLPHDAKAHELLGDIARERGQLRSALAYYETAIALDPSYYRPRLQAGLVLYQLKEPDRAVALLARSIESLPTAPAAYHLGLIARDAHDVQQAIRYFQLAASSDSAVGRLAALALVQLDLERNPERYVDVEPRVDSAGNVWMVVSNHAPLTVESVVVEAAVTRMEGGVSEGPVRLSTGGETLPPEGVAQLPTSLGPLANPRAIRLVRAEVQAAEAAR